MQEANALLPRLRPLLEGLREARAGIELRQRELRTIPDKARFNGMARRAQSLLLEIDRLVSYLQRSIDEVQSLGVEIKDLATGLVDFPSLHGGHEVYLCWKLDEDEVGWWHEVDVGFAGRKPLDWAT